MRCPVVGFDLDMTLVDSADAIVGAVLHVGEHYAVPIDAEAIRATVGIPLDEVFTRHLPGASVDDCIEVYRAHYRRHGIAASSVLPGAAEAIAATHALGGRVVVVSAKHAPAVRAVLDGVGLQVDAVEGERFGEAKGAALRLHGAHVFVGDHVGDVLGARAGGAVAVGVSTGPTSAAELAAAGADVVLDDLRQFPGWLGSYVLSSRLDSLSADLAARAGVVVAFSGGADSAFLLAAAVRALGADRVVAATAVSDSLADGELAAAAAFAERLGVRHLTPATRELDREGYRANGADRCFHCKAELLDVLTALRGDVVPADWSIVTGTNADDVVAGFRPGIAAAAGRGASTPLADAGLTKAQVREASREWDLPTWDKPQAACLSSRVAYGLEITPLRLARVDRAEGDLRRVLTDAGIRVTDLRVRDLGDRASIEVDAVAVPAVSSLQAASDVVLAAGFARVDVDPRGFRSGSMNEALAQD